MSDATEHTVVYVDCELCTEADIVTLVEHPADSIQGRAALDAHDTVADEHHEATGHRLDVNFVEKEPGAAYDAAQTLAQDIDGVADDAYSEDLRADGGQQ